MNLGIVGYRNYNNYEEFESKLLSKYNPQNISKIISGGCKGTDKLAELFAKKYNIPLIIHHANWSKYGKSAGPIRNKLIVDDSTELVAFLSLDSVGTKITIKYANDKNIPVVIFSI